MTTRTRRGMSPLDRAMRASDGSRGSAPHRLSERGRWSSRIQAATHSTRGALGIASSAVSRSHGSHGSHDSHTHAPRPSTVGALAAAGLVVGLIIGVVFIGSAAQALALGLVLAPAAGSAPLLRQRSREASRSARIATQLPDVLDLLAVTVSAGLGFDAALSRVSSAFDGPLAEELRRVRHEVTLGATRAEALKELSRRTGLPQLRAFAAAIAQADALGAPLADVLRAQATTQRSVHSLRLEERAQQLPVKLVVPLVLCLLPALFVVVIGPAAVSLIDGSTLP